MELADRDQLAQRINSLIGPINTGVYETVTQGVAETEKVLPDIRNSGEQGYLFSLIAKTNMRGILVEKVTHDFHFKGWEVGGNPARMGQTFLLNPEAGFKMRLLKEARQNPGGVPAAGYNKERNDAWQEPLTGFKDAWNDAKRTVPIGGNFLLLWDARTVDNEPVVSVRVVQTLKPGTFGKKVPLGLELKILPGTTLYDNLSFSGGGDDENFFANISQEENQGGAA